MREVDGGSHVEVEAGASLRAAPLSAIAVKAILEAGRKDMGARGHTRNRKEYPGAILTPELRAENPDGDGMECLLLKKFGSLWFGSVQGCAIFLLFWGYKKLFFCDTYMQLGYMCIQIYTILSNCYFGHFYTSFLYSNIDYDQSKNKVFFCTSLPSRYIFTASYQRLYLP